MTEPLETAIECPRCQLGSLRLEPNLKYEDAYLVYTCNVCEHMVVDYDSVNYYEV